MPEYQAPVKDMLFVIKQLADLNRLSQLPGYGDATPDVAEAILEQAAKLASEVFSPISQSGDQHGTFINNGKVVSPPGFTEAYRQFAENGWQGLSQATDVGGQGLPYLLHSAVAEMWNASNISLALCPLLTSGAIEAISAHASDSIKQIYLPHMVAATWTGTMNLTEPQAGSDLSAVMSRAEPEGGYYRIRGQKIFITWGEHEMAENIIHLVLARLPGAPEGVKGISLFVVPRYLVEDDASLGARNDIKLVSMEKKLGIHAAPTCVLSFGDNEGAIGYLIGEPHQGLACMFTMMNHARLEVGIEGVGLCDNACQKALAYARDRIQGYAPDQPGRVAIIHHADVRRMLMQMRALTEATRALAYVTASVHDMAQLDTDSAKHQRRLDLLTPVVKAWCTEVAQEVAYLGVQVHGGMGFIEEAGAAQTMRDVRITTIYEGTTGIQAMDLVGRKILRDQGQAVTVLIGDLKLFNAEIGGHPGLTRIYQRFETALGTFEHCTQWLIAAAPTNPQLAGSIAVNYLMLMGNLLGGWLLAKSALVSLQEIEAGESDPFFQNKISTATFYAEHILPRCEGLGMTIESGADSVMSIDADAF